MIFIHSSFRVGSTWLWSCFRRNPAALAYREIFNETLATLTAKEARLLGHASWHSKHPPGAGYFLEYLPLLCDAGVRGFRPEMAFENFIPRRGAGLPAAEAAYIAALIAHAEMEGRVPVLTETRSLGRAAAIKAAFGGFHVMLYRNTFRQWASYTEQWMEGNPFFLASIWRTIESSPHDAALADIARRFPPGDRTARDPNTFIAGLLLHAVLYARAVAVADLVIDIDSIATQPSRRVAVEAAIAAHTGLDVDLSDVQESFAYSLVDAGPPSALQAALQAFDIREAAPCSPAGLDFAARALADGLAGYSAYRAGTSQLLPALEQAHARDLAAVQAELDAVRRSHSWRATAPMRGLAVALRRLRAGVSHAA